MPAEVLIRVTPGAAKTAIGGIWEGPEGERRLIVRVTAPPEKGKANRAVIAALAKEMNIAKSALSVIRGQTDRNKTIAVETDDAPDMIRALWRRYTV